MSTDVDDDGLWDAETGFLDDVSIVSDCKNINCVKGNTTIWYGVMNLFQMTILEAYAILQYSVIVVAVEIESKVMKL